jgi:hypothetical protein
LKDLKFQDTKSIEELNKNLASINCPTLYWGCKIYQEL